MLIFEIVLESSSRFWTAAFKSKCLELAEPTLLLEMIDRKIKKEER